MAEMIRYEILSNMASSDTGLQSHPELADLMETLAAQNVDSRFVRYLYKDSEEINLASSKHAKGVNVRSTTTRQFPPEGHIRGCLNWMRAATANPNRAVHLHLDKIRATNGAALIFAQLFSKKHKVFVTGQDELNMRKLTSQVDLSGKRIPEGLAKSKALQEEYITRSSRVSTFMKTLPRLKDMAIFDAELQAKLARIIQSRDGGLIKELSPAEVINIGLALEMLERYEKLVEQFFDLLVSESAAGDLPALFDLFTQGMSFDKLRASLKVFVLEDKKDRVKDKRTLASELRIGLQRGDANLRPKFQSTFLPLVVKQRITQDPRLYQNVIHLLPTDPTYREAISNARKLFMEWQRLSNPRNPKNPAEAKTLATPEDAQGLFELVVNFTFQARFTQNYVNQGQPSAVILARNLMSCFVFDSFDVSRIRNLHPNLPVKGVAKNLAGKVRPNNGEIARIRGDLWSALFPLARIGLELSKSLHTRAVNRDALEKEEAVSAFMLGSHSLLQATYYVLGRSRLDTPTFRAMMNMGANLGIGLLESRDQIRHWETLRNLDRAEEELVEGYLLLMNREDSKLFPLASTPEHLALAYQHLFAERIVSLVQRQVNSKLNYLYKRHGDELFNVIYDHVTWTHGLSLSRDQLGTLLVAGRVFEKPRLKEFGFGKWEQGKGQEGENHWLHPDGTELPEALLNAFNSDQVGQVHLRSLKVFMTLVDLYEKIAGNGKSGTSKIPPLAKVLRTLAKEEMFDLHQPEARAALAESLEGKALTELLQVLANEQPPLFKTKTDNPETREFTLTGTLAYLPLLKENHVLEIDGATIKVRLLSGRSQHLDKLDKPSRWLQGALSERVGGQNSQAPVLRRALEMIFRHDTAWRALCRPAFVPLLDQMLQNTVLAMTKPRPPMPKDLAKQGDDNLMCLGTTSADQAKFHKIAKHTEKKDVYATLSEMASWLQRFHHAREELESYRDITDELLEIISGLNLSPFEAPHILTFTKVLKQLRHALDIRPEYLQPADLKTLQEKALEISRLVRKLYQSEQSLMMRDRWVARIGMKLRAMRPNVRLTYVDMLHEQKFTEEQSDADASGKDASGKDGPGEDSAAKAAQKTRREDYQTFSERMRNILEIRARLENKRVFVLSPTNTQQRLTMSLIDRLYRFIGVPTPIFVDISGCESFVDELRKRIPPYRLFKLNEM